MVKPQTPMPKNFREFAPGRTYRELERTYLVSSHIITRWLTEAGLRLTNKNKRPVPADFGDMCKQMSQAGLAKHYNVGLRVIVRWLDESPLQYRDWTRDAAMHASREGGRLGRAQQLRNGAKPSTFVIKPICGDRLQVAAVTEADRAMRWLQRHGIGPCWPLRIHGRTLPGYRYMNRLWQADELIAEAKRRGWNPDDWRNLAA